MQLSFDIGDLLFNTLEKEVILIYMRRYALLIFISFCLVVSLRTDESYTVQRGDSLIRIANRFNISVNELKQMNRLSNDNIRAGQKLIIRRDNSQNRAYYTVRSGDNLTSIARNHNTTVALLVELNNLKSSNIRINQRLIVPDNTRNVNTSNSSNQSFHTVQAGDTLAAISRRYGVNTNDLIALNGLSGNTIFPGQKIYYQNGNVTQDTNNSIGNTTHTVLKGENLYRIALNYGVTVDEIRNWNRLSNINIREGQVLQLLGVTEPQNIATANDRNNNSLPIYRGNAIWPVSSIIVLSEFGMRSGRPHQGIDLGGSIGTPIFSVLPGTVIFSGIQRGYGNVVIISHDNNIQTVYAHNEQNLVAVGDIVTQGQTIAAMGNTGNASTYHLHFEYRIQKIARNPRELLRPIS